MCLHDSSVLTMRINDNMFTFAWPVNSSYYLGPWFYAVLIFILSVVCGSSLFVLPYFFVYSHSLAKAGNCLQFTEF